MERDVPRSARDLDELMNLLNEWDLQNTIAVDDGAQESDESMNALQDDNCAPTDFCHSVACRSELSSLASAGDSGERLLAALDEWDADCKKQSLVDKKNLANTLLKQAKELNDLHEGNLGYFVSRARDCLVRASDQLDGHLDATVDADMEGLMYEMHECEKKCLCRSHGPNTECSLSPHYRPKPRIPPLKHTRTDSTASTRCSVLSARSSAAGSLDDGWTPR